MKKLIPIIVITIFIASLLFAWQKNRADRRADFIYNNPPMILLLNEQRVKAGDNQLVRNPKLEKTAMEKACDMDKLDYFEHEDLQGRMSWHLLQEEGLDYTKAGENIARDMSSVRDTMEWFMKSPTHKANILDPEFTQVGYATCGRYTVQHFLKP